ncbi:MAG: GNAT family N-acetyltransferase [Clostridiales bacterium]|nr:GNAT family N-acetyltransferase [Clostridiales bacterium]
MILNNDKITIRTIEQADMDFIQTFWGDEESMLASGGVYNVRDEDKEALFNILNKGEEFNNHYIILNDEMAIGDLSIRKYDDKTKAAHMDMKILHVERNKGFGKKALQAVLDYYFNTVKGEELFFELWLVNYFAQHKLKEYGFEATLIMEDATIMTLTKENYEKGALHV